MARISIILPDDMKNRIEKIAVREDRNLSWIVRAAIEEYLKKQEN